MSFMESQLTGKQYWLVVDYDGIDYTPDDLFDVRLAWRVLHCAESTACARFWRELWPIIRDYVGEQRFSIERQHSADANWVPQVSLVRGYGVRLSAPGYLDCTEWEVYTTKREALARARDLDRGED
jgi:hypothetical protein